MSFNKEELDLIEGVFEKHFYELSKEDVNKCTEDYRQKIQQLLCKIRGIQDGK